MGRRSWPGGGRVGLDASSPPRYPVETKGSKLISLALPRRYSPGRWRARPVGSALILTLMGLTLFATPGELASTGTAIQAVAVLALIVAVWMTVAIAPVVR